MLLSWYFGQIERGAVAKACSDIVRLLAGYTPVDVRAIAGATFTDELAAPLSTRRLGNRVLPRGIRFLREARELIAGLQNGGFDLIAVSGSNVWSVEPVFRALGVPAEKVVGLEVAVRNGLLTSEVIEPVPIREGKIPALRRSTKALPVLVASDSKNDLPLFLYSSGLKVRINSRSRDTADFFGSAGLTPDSSWVLIESPEVIG
jgi:phosphoserine phosphatase